MVGKVEKQKLQQFIENGFVVTIYNDGTRISESEQQGKNQMHVIDRTPEKKYIPKKRKRKRSRQT